MTEIIGILLDNDEDGTARVITDRRGGCGGCHTGHSGCRTCLSGSKTESRATNTIGAQSGDLVTLSLPSSRVLKGAALLYLLPIAALLAGAFTGLWLGGLFGLSETAGAAIGSLAGMTIAIWVVIRLGRNPALVRKMTPDIISVIQRAGHPVPPQNGECCG